MFDISPYLGLPELASAHGAQLDYWTGIVHLLMLVLFLIWTPFFMYTLVRFSKKRNPKASYEGAKGTLSTWQEIGVVVLEVILLLAFAIPTWATIKQDFPNPKEATVVNVVGEQFAWNVHYPGPDGVFGKRDISRLNVSTNPLGIDWNDPNSADDIVTIGELRVPVDKPVIINLSSKDVIHSFGLNQMRVKQDAIPGIVIPVYFTPIKTGNHFEISCAQLCGLGHSRMRGQLIVNTPADYEAWVQEKLAEIEEYGR